MDRRPEDATYVEEAVFVTRPKTCAPGTWCGCCLSVDALMLGETATHRRAADDRAACQATSGPASSGLHADGDPGRAGRRQAAWASSSRGQSEERIASASTAYLLIAVR